MKTKFKDFIKSAEFKIGAGAFLLPMLTLYIIFAFNEVHPFGDKQILVTDLWHQYYPFLSELQEKLKTGQSLLYSNRIGMGINFLALMAYYCSSVLNFFTVFFSKEQLRDVLTLFVTIKVGFSGLFFSMYLRKVFGRRDFSVVAFSMAYALCGYILGYYWNVMWLDSVAMLPLVMLGVHLLITENKASLYTISLALAVIFNFYIGYMICIFTALYFFAECIALNVDKKELLRKLGKIALFSLIALALTAFITVPTYNALQNSYSAEKGFTSKIGFTESFIDIIGRTASFVEPAAKEGLPNIFSAFISVILLGFFLTSKKIKVREKCVASFLIVFLAVSMNLNILNYAWHGFHDTNMVPYRFAFVFSFVLITAAYRAYTTIDKKDAKLGLAAGVILTIFVPLCAWKSAEKATVFGCAALGIVYLVILHSWLNAKNSHSKKVFSNVLCGLIVVEMIINVAIAVPTVRVTTYSTYYYRGDDIENVVQETGARESYGRVENAQEYILNDPALYGFDGVSTFTSTANWAVTKFLGEMAICAPKAANRYYYETTSPLTNVFLGVERVIFRSMDNLNPYLEEEASSDDVVIYRNSRYSSLGFMTKDDIFDVDFENSNPFEIQNELFRKATGLDGDLYTEIPLYTVNQSNMTVLGSVNGIYEYKIHDESDDSRALTINYIAPDDNPLFAYIDSPAAENVTVSGVKYKAAKRKYIFPAGTYDEGDKVSFVFDLDDSTLSTNKHLVFYVYSMNRALFDDGMELLSDEQLEITRKDSTVIEGNIDVKKDGLLYLSIPYEKGWKLYVDGVKTEIKPLEDAMITADLTKGYHEIKLTYSPDGFVLGVVVSIVGLAAFVVLMILKKKKSRE
jgi:uncharacterized membrane protein YfhO